MYWTLFFFPTIVARLEHVYTDHLQFFINVLSVLRNPPFEGGFLPEPPPDAPAAPRIEKNSPKHPKIIQNQI